MTTMQIMGKTPAPHLLSPELGVLDALGRRYCTVCRLPEDNRHHALRPANDPAKNRILGETDEAQSD